MNLIKDLVIPYQSLMNGLEDLNNLMPEGNPGAASVELLHKEAQAFFQVLLEHAKPQILDNEQENKAV